MNAVMLSIRPEWCAKIASGEKTIEIRKSKPKLETPFKCYIYCTKRPPYLVLGDVFCGNWETEYTTTYGYSREEADRIWGTLNGKVIGEFIFDTFVVDKTFGHDPLLYAAACMTPADTAAYCVKSEMYGWHISELKIYDTPKSLSEFGLTRPPQSWCYVEGLA